MIFRKNTYFSSYPARTISRRTSNRQLKIRNEQQDDFPSQPQPPPKSNGSTTIGRWTSCGVFAEHDDGSRLDHAASCRRVIAVIDYNEKGPGLHERHSSLGRKAVGSVWRRGLVRHGRHSAGRIVFPHRRRHGHCVWRDKVVADSKLRRRFLHWQ